MLFLTVCALKVDATDYHVNGSPPYVNISDVPWANVTAGDRIYIHWRPQAYHEKWVINAAGTAADPIYVLGVNGPQGQQPVIDGRNATTASGLNFWNESRGLIKIGGSNNPADGLPQHIIIENLALRSARPPYTFSDDKGQTQSYSDNAAALYVEKAAHLTLKNNTFYDSGNGLFIGAFDGLTEDVLISGNHFYDNGNVGSIYEHNSYTAGIDVTFEFNHYGALRSGAGGNNLKDRSAGLVVRYNWIEDGNRQLDLVDAEDSSVLVNHPSYHQTYVYGNVLVEHDNQGNSQILHYGGDSGTEADYRKGDLYFYHNTIVSTRSGNTTLMRLSTQDETAHLYNNVFYGTAAGNKLALYDGEGTLNVYYNWLKSDWRDCHCVDTGSVNVIVNQVVGNDPLFNDLLTQDYRPQLDSALIDAGAGLPQFINTTEPVLFQYNKHQQGIWRPVEGSPDLGAFERCIGAGCDVIFMDGFE